MILLINTIIGITTLFFIGVYLIPRTRKIARQNSELFAFFAALIGTFIGVSLGLSLENRNQNQISQTKYEILLDQSIADLEGNHNSLKNLYVKALATYTAKISVNDTSAKFNESRPNTFPVPLSTELLLNNTELFAELSQPALQYLSSTYFNIRNINNNLSNVQSIDKNYIELLRDNLNQFAVLIQLIRIEKKYLSKTNNETLKLEMEQAVKFPSSYNPSNDLRIYIKTDFKPGRYETRDVTTDE